MVMTWYLAWVCSSTLSRMSEDDESFFGRDSGDDLRGSPLISVNCHQSSNMVNTGRQNYKAKGSRRFEMTKAQCMSYFPSDFFGDRMDDSHLRSS